MKFRRENPELVNTSINFKSLSVMKKDEKVIGEVDERIVLPVSGDTEG